jgi:linoleoyl-CoA desaturase
VNKYFKDRNLRKQGNNALLVKSIFMLSVFFIPLLTLIFVEISATPMLFLLYTVSGLGMAGIGMTIMHDALHGSFSSNSKFNYLMGLSINLIGANAAVWKIQHNVLHHTYTNVEDIDDDINVPPILRFSPNSKWYWFHKFQYIYVWPFYCLTTIIWTSIKDFVKIGRYRKMGFFQAKRELVSVTLRAVANKILFYSYTLVLPMVVLPFSFWTILAAYFLMHLVTGLILSIIFQIAHVMPSSEFPEPDANGRLASSWSVHQMMTTTNFSPKSRIFSWLIGGLNYQIEHHLLPNISHIHYRNLAPIVRKTAAEFHLPYNVRKDFFTAVSDHVDMLKTLGKKDIKTFGKKDITTLEKEDIKILSPTYT